MQQKKMYLKEAMHMLHGSNKVAWRRPQIKRGIKRLTFVQPLLNM